MVRKRIKVMVTHTLKTYDGEIHSLKRGGTKVMSFKNDAVFAELLKFNKIEELPMVEEIKRRRRRSSQPDNNSCESPEDAGMEESIPLSQV